MYIDDLIVANVARNRSFKPKDRQDKVLIENAHKAYQDSGLARSPGKAFGWGAGTSGDAAFTAWGTHVDSGSGHVGPSPAKRLILAGLLMHVSHMASVPHSVMISLVALTVHPFMRRRELSATWHRTYKFMADYKDSRGTLLSLPAGVREELCFAGLLVGVAFAYIHSQIDTHISATDATPIAAGAVNNQVSRRLAEALCRSVYYKAGHHKLVPDQILDAILVGRGLK